MKLLLLTSCLVATAFAGAVYPGFATGVGPAYGVGVGAAGVGVGAAGYGVGRVGLGGAGAGAVGVGGGVGLGGGAGAGAGAAKGVDKVKAFVEARNLAANKNNAQRWAAEGSNIGRTSREHGNDASTEDKGARWANAKYGSRAGNWDQNQNAYKKLADNAASNAYDANKWGHRSDANQALNDQVWAQGNQWYKGRRNNDDIDYAYDKKFDLRDSDNGGYEFAEHSDSHALDHLKDRAANYDRNVDKQALWASAADAQKAARESSASAAADASSANWDKFARKNDNYAHADGRNKDWAQKLDQSQGGKRVWSDARKTASDIYKDMSTADGAYQRNAAAARGKAAQYGPETLAYGVAGAGGYAAKPGYGAVGGLTKTGQAGDVAQAWDQAAKLGLRNTEAGATNDQSQANYAKDQWLSDRVKGFNRNKKAGAADAGFSDWAKQGHQAAKKADAAAAEAATAWNKDQNVNVFNEDLWKKEAEKKRLSDRNKNHKVYKKYFNNKRHGGDNWERLKYDRDQSDDAFGYDTAAKKDWGQRANANRWDEKYDANGRQSQAARGAAAARQASSSDWNKRNDGYKAADARHENEWEGDRRSWDNAAWKKNQKQNTFDAQNANAARADRGLGRAGFDVRAARAAGAGAGAGGVLGGGGGGAAAIGLGGAGAAGAAGAGGVGIAGGVNGLYGGGKYGGGYGYYPYGNGYDYNNAYAPYAGGYPVDYPGKY